MRGIVPDLVGKTFGRWSVLERSVSGKGASRWKCYCSCGTEKVVYANGLLSGDSTSCGCSNRKSFGEAAKILLLQSYKQSAKKRSLIWELTDAQFFSLTLKECLYCGRTPIQKQVVSRCHKATGYYLYNGVDRKDNDDGYTVTNSAPCCMSCNRAKSNISMENWQRQLKRIVEFNATRFGYGPEVKK